MIQIDPIDDYIEPQLIIQAKSHEIEELTRKGDFQGSFRAIIELQDAAEQLEGWLRRKIAKDENDAIA